MDKLHNGSDARGPRYLAHPIQPRFAPSDRVAQHIECSLARPSQMVLVRSGRGHLAGDLGCAYSRAINGRRKEKPPGDEAGRLGSANLIWIGPATRSLPRCIGIQRHTNHLPHPLRQWAGCRCISVLSAKARSDPTTKASIAAPTLRASTAVPTTTMILFTSSPVTRLEPYPSTLASSHAAVTAITERGDFSGAEHHEKAAR